MISFNMRPLFLARGIKHPFTYLCNRGYSSNTASKLLNKHVKSLNFTQVERICLMLDCTPNDLLEWNPGKKISKPESKALSELIRHNDVSNVSDLLYQVPVNELENVAEYLKSKIDKHQ